MRRFKELNEKERKRAFDLALENVLIAICEGDVHFNDEFNKDDLQARIDAAIAKAAAMYTPWFTGEYIMDTCGKELSVLARMDAENAYYPSISDVVIRL
jgi:hypothetical protein